ncbi:MAG: ABC transporter ATP-binding protein [Beijerinckiaceae bacterium]
MARLTIDSVTRMFGTHAALDKVSMTVEHGEFVAVLGPSGCGKTTLLRLVAGFDQVSDGAISIDKKCVSGRGNHVPPEERRMGIVFQSYALWPHMTVAENVAYALKVQGLAAQARTTRVTAALDLVGLTAFADRRPASLSGGQRQRVALARCLAMEPSIVLLDEPLANLDVHLRSTMEEEFANFHKRTGTTMFYITHDQAEAMALADRIAVMDQGKLLQLATPSVLYREPANATVARFIGAGIVLPAKPVRAVNGGAISVDIMGHRCVVRCAGSAVAQGEGAVCVRANDLVIDPLATSGLAGHIKRLVYQGGHFHADVVLEHNSAIVLPLVLPEPTMVAPGDKVRVVIRDGWLLPEV